MAATVTAFALTTSPGTAHAQGGQSSSTYSDAPGNVYDNSGNVVTPDDANADAHTATLSDQGGIVTMTLSTYANENPSTDPGWQTNNSQYAYTYASWVLNADGRQYAAFFDTNANAGQPAGTLDGSLFEVVNGSLMPLSCDVTPSFSPTTGYGLQFDSGCLGLPQTIQWYAYIIYHPAGTSPGTFHGKAVPEQGAYPKSAQYAGSVTQLAPPVFASGQAVDDHGYRLVATDGGIFSFGTAQFYGSTGNVHLNQPVVGMASTPDGKGYWLVAKDGGIFAFGDAHYYGSTGNIHLNQPIVGMASTLDGGGYWLVAKDGGIFAFGDAHFYGSTGNIHLNQPIVGMAATPSGNGYWLVASDGGIFAFGDAGFHGSAGDIHLNQPVVGMSSSLSGNGYRLVATDGGIFSYGDAAFYGSAGNIHLNKPIVGMAANGDGLGYWLVASDGGIFSYGDAGYFGSTGNIPLNQPIVGMAPSP